MYICAPTNWNKHTDTNTKTHTHTHTCIKCLSLTHSVSHHLAHKHTRHTQACGSRFRQNLSPFVYYIMHTHTCARTHTCLCDYWFGKNPSPCLHCHLNTMKAKNQVILTFWKVRAKKESGDSQFFQINIEGRIRQFSLSWNEQRKIRCFPLFRNY